MCLARENGENRAKDCRYLRIRQMSVSSGLWNSVASRTQLPHQNQLSDLPTYFLHHQLFNMDQKEQNLQMAITDFNAGKFESGTQAARAYGALRQLFTIAWVASSH